MGKWKNTVYFIFHLFHFKFISFLIPKTSIDKSMSNRQLVTRSGVIAKNLVSDNEELRQSEPDRWTWVQRDTKQLRNVNEHWTWRDNS